MMLRFLLVLAFAFLAEIPAQDTSPAAENENDGVTGYSTLCQSCLSFFVHLPGFFENYTPSVGIDAKTLCTALASQMPSVGEPCFRLFAEYWPSVTNATTLDICTAMFFC